ncbi:MAG TPA: DUF58 domain-containing protein [Anaerolineales bacterium]|nr:DUF58 domain-containing protein [Anaerolineales bacterium]
MKTKIALKSRLLPTLVGVVLVMYVLESYRGWVVLFVGLSGALLVGYFWVQSLAKGISFIRRMRFGWAQVGDRLEEQFELHNKGWAPGLWMEVNYQSTIPEYQPSRVASVGAAGNHSKWHTSGMCTRRGVFSLGPVTIHTGDPLGIFDLTLEHPVVNTLLVTPPIIPLPFIEVAPGGRAGDGRPRRDALEETISVSSVREYYPGDSLRLIHWRTTARKDRFYVRNLDNTPASDWWIFLDLDQKTIVGNGFDSNEEHAVILAASLADRGMFSGNPVGLVTHGETLTWLPPRHGEEHRQSIMRALALASAGDCSIDRLLDLARPVFRQNPSLILITSNTDPSWVDTLMPLLRRGAIPTILLLDPTSYPPLKFKAAYPPQAVMNLLGELGVSRNLLSREYFDRPEARPGQQGHWAWHKTASSRAFLEKTPGDLAWKEM